MVDNLLLALFVLFGVLFIPLLGLAIYWLYIVLEVTGGLLTAWNEKWYFKLVRRIGK